MKPHGTSKLIPYSCKREHLYRQYPPRGKAARKRNRQTHLYQSCRTATWQSEMAYGAIQDKVGTPLHAASRERRRAQPSVH